MKTPENLYFQNKVGRLNSMPVAPTLSTPESFYFLFVMSYFWLEKSPKHVRNIEFFKETFPLWGLEKSVSVNQVKKKLIRFKNKLLTYFMIKTLPSFWVSSKKCFDIYFTFFLSGTFMIFAYYCNHCSIIFILFFLFLIFNLFFIV